MLMFCPTCANILGVEEGPNCLRFSCATCPYVQNIKNRISNKIYPQLKEVRLLKLKEHIFSLLEIVSVSSVCILVILESKENC